MPDGGKVGEPVERRTRAERLDETLAILDGLWSGEPFRFDGTHYRFPPMAFRPTPVQRPRIPVWVVGAWPSERSMGRAARFDGLLPNVLGGGSYDPDLIRAMRDWVAERRDGGIDGYDIVLEGPIDPGPPDDILREFEAAGATWWIHSDWAASDVGAARRRIAEGPPRD
jgi:alkanesulfonate monooxygenase SsuD/methylene tetrahydromethanopterin reductase-like flavin-dependent oxidoreductase (luciferase family)